MSEHYKLRRLIASESYYKDHAEDYESHRVINGRFVPEPEYQQWQQDKEDAEKWRQFKNIAESRGKDE